MLLWLGLAALLLVAAALRIYQLDAVDLRGDEAYTAVHWIQRPLTGAWFDMVGYEPHPGGIFIVYWFWAELAGTSEFALRVLPLLFNVLGSAVVIAFSRRLFRNWWLAFMVGLVWAFHPFLIWHAQDARNYGIIGFFTPLSFYLLWRAVEHRQPRRHFGVWWPYIIVQAASLYIYYFEVFPLLAQMIYVFVWRRAALRHAFRAWVTVGLLCLPNLVQLYWLGFVTDYEGTAAGADFGDLFEYFVPTLLVGANTVPWHWGMLFVILFAGGLAWIVHRGKDWAALLLLWGIVPPATLLLVGNWMTVFRPRYVIHSVPALIIGTVAILYALAKSRWGPRVGRYAASGGVAVYLILAGGEVYDYFHSDPPKSPDWEGLTSYLQARTTQYDAVLSGSADPALEYYYRGPGKVRFLSIGSEGDEAFFASLLEEHDAIYVLADANTSYALRYFQDHAQHIPGDTWAGVIQYRAREVRSREIDYPLTVQFGDVALLRGYTLLQGGEGGTILQLYWEPLRQTAVDYSVLLHLTPGHVEPSQPMAPAVAVLDHGVQGGVISTQHWPVGVLIRDPVPVPVELPPATYGVRVGWYETYDAANLVPLADPTLQERYQGRYYLGEITLPAH
ncbi:MAG: hypothetical protein GYB66_15305 [Chloroflexi bacterium]|nr:hypothetical protein [Chloroflexota bacterium]